MSKNLKLEEPKSDDPLREEILLLNEFLHENDNGQTWYYDFKLKNTESGKQIVALNRDSQAKIVLASLTGLKKGLSDGQVGFLTALLGELLRKKLPLADEAIITLCQICREGDSRLFWNSPLLVIRAITEFYKQNVPSDLLKKELNTFSDSIKLGSNTDYRKAALTLNELLGNAPSLFIEPGEAWSDCALADLDSFSEENRVHWEKLISHAQSATGGKPTGKWSKAAEAFVNSITWNEFQSTMLKWFPLVDKPRTIPKEKEHDWEPDYANTILDHHADLLKGLAWMAGMKEDAQLARAIANLALSSYKKIPGIGPRLIKVGNACVYSLGAMPGDASLGQLAFLKVKVKFGTAQKGIEKALNVTAERVGISRDELEEISVPEYGFTTVGERLETLGEFTAQLRLLNNGKTDLKWIKQDGKEQKSVPAAVKSDFPEELKELKTIAKDITRMHSAQRDRLDGMFLKCKEWKLDIWKERYLDHPLLGTLTRRLIWTVKDKQDSSAVCWLEDQLVDINDQPITPSDDALIEPWHPVGHTVEEITQWRDWLVRHEIQQPFKQAHREVYLLTDAASVLYVSDLNFRYRTDSLLSEAGDRDSNASKIAMGINSK
ncbi:MAG: hypothetical protein COA78_06040 [Blastopirellula sp.]|nr:MAG: hypothetical protein COA78_06040 [Blastopirellula sp.]